MFVTDASVSQGIRRARRTLAECGLDLNLVRTQHGHGYRLDCDVAVIDPESERTIKRALTAIVESGNRRKEVAINHLVEGDITTTAAQMH